ncbi:MAG: PhzF family phenazine biosynthesis protein [Gammaproteobacteria bacterium]|nr:MAG: PhzF family phenazine biosynthesis protein [Gammaproteobacteria bacterium]
MALPAFTLHVVDVFADRPLAGNPLAVLIADRLPDSDLRQAIARETNLSETTFLGPCADPDGAWSIRIHTPSEELPFAGHPVLGTAWVIRERLLDERPEGLLLRTGKGAVPVGFEGDGADALVWLQAPEAEFEDLPVAELDGLVSDAFLSGPLPGLVGRNGPSMMLVTAADPDALADPLTDPNALTALLRRTGRSGILMAAPLATEDEQPGWEVRVFFLAGTLREDPATGSAAALFGDALRQNGRTGACVLRQGVAMQRPSRLHLRIADEGPIAVGGQVQPVWSGRNG